MPTHSSKEVNLEVCAPQTSKVSLQDYAPVAHPGNMLDNTSLLPSLAFLSHFPTPFGLFPETTSQIIYCTQIHKV